MAALWISKYCIHEQSGVALRLPPHSKLRLQPNLRCPRIARFIFQLAPARG